MSNLVLGIIKNVGRKYVEPFIVSLRASGYDDEIVLFGKNVGPKAKKLLTYHKVRLIQYNAIRLSQIKRYNLRSLFVKLYGTFFCDKILPLRDTVVKLLWLCNVSRYYFYDDFLRKASAKYKMILMCDVRDTIFQQYPFPEKMESDIYCFEEYLGFKISDRVYSRKWVIDHYGKEILRKLSDKSIICSGVILGTHDGCLRFLRAMKSYLWKQHHHWVSDQTVLNYLIYMNYLTGVKVIPFGEGPVMHIGSAPRNKINIRTDGKVLCNDGTVCPVIHQYDWHPDIKANVLKLYSSL
jgi:hypothetical protein